MKKPISFHSEGMRLVGDVYYPRRPDARSATRRRGPKKLVVLKGYGHYEVYREPAFGEVMRGALAWSAGQRKAQGYTMPDNLEPNRNQVTQAISVGVCLALATILLALAGVGPVWW